MYVNYIEFTFKETEMLQRSSIELICLEHMYNCVLV